jgi:hypothetical protein
MLRELNCVSLQLGVPFIGYEQPAKLQGNSPMDWFGLIPQLVGVVVGGLFVIIWIKGTHNYLD